MTTAADDSAVEDAFEALLAGRPVPEGAAGLVAFTEAVRASATRPGRPNAALAELLATGLLTDQSSPSVRTARSDGSPQRGARVRNRRRFAMIFPVLLAKILSAGAVAQATAGAGIVVVAVTGAGVVGVLPDPVQDTVATVVETVTPLDLEGGDEDTGDEVVSDEVVGDEVIGEDETGTTDPGTVPTPVVETTAPVEATDGEFDAVAWAENGPAEDQSFGEWVREAARAGKADGKVISEWAHRKGEKAEDYVPVTPVPTTEAEPTVTPEDDGVAEAEVVEADEDRGGNRGNGGGGNGNGNGGGNAGRGNGRN
jgi:hypothetical protein